MRRQSKASLDQLAAMRAFARVVESGSFTRAAQSLEMPKPTVSKLIQTLEAHLRTKLLSRTTRRVTVTPDGAAYYERAVRLLLDIDELDSSLALSQAKPRGKLRIDVSSGLARLVLIPALPDFFERYPDIQIDLGVSDRPADLVSENVDCVVRAGVLSDQSLIARKVADLEMITCAALSYVARHGEPRHPHDMESGHRVISYFHSITGRLMPFDFSRNGETIEIRGTYAVAFNEASAYVDATVAGLGIGQLSRAMAQQHLDQGALQQILTDWTSDPLPLYVVYPPNRHLSSRLRIFVDWVAQVIGGSPLLRPR